MVGRGMAVIRIRAAHTSGFTLFEVLAALAVLGIATGIFASLFVASMNIGHLNQSSAMAASLAEEQLLIIRNHPQGFAWPDAATLALGAFAPVTALERPATGPAETKSSTVELSATTLPAMMPFDPSAYTRARNFYEQYTWQAFARLPEPDAGYLEVATVIRWQEKGKPQSITLTSAVARSVVEGGA